MRCLVITATAAFLITAFSASAEIPADFYKGKTVRLMIGQSAGGDYDAWGRLVARHIKDHIPGNPNVVAENVVGAAGMTLANEMFHTLPKDGTVFGLYNRGMPFEPMMGNPAAQFEPLKMNWIGSPETDVAVCTARTDAAVQKTEDLYSKELIVGGTSPGADTVAQPQFLANLLGLKLKLVKGFAGSNEVFLAVERGEVEGVCNSYASITRQSIYRDGKVRLLFQIALTPDPRIKDVPMARDLAKTEADREAMDIFLARLGIGRPFVAPPGVPADRLAALRHAFEDTMADPQYLEDAKTMHLNPSPMGWQEIAKVLDTAYKMPKASIARVVEALK
jgi:tripartite-type tricarboxylate transporter receptor subunit TctC